MSATKPPAAGADVPEPTETFLPRHRSENQNPRSESNLAPAATIGRYSVIAHIGSGGMGAVYAAYDPDLDRKVAVKLVRPDRSTPEQQASLLREARALARLAHPNVVRVYDVGLHGEEIFFAMEFLSGMDLRQWLARRRPDWRQALRLFIEVARGLAAAHAQGVIHRDLKPANILVGEDGVARIADFGLARSLGAEEAPREEQKRSPSPGSPKAYGQVGTPAFMAPELARGGPADELSDQYSFCVALHLALYGEHPFPKGKQTTASYEETADVPQRRVPAGLRRVLQRGLSADPADRFPSLTILEHALRSFEKRRRWGWAAVAAAVVVVVVASVGVLAKREPPPCEEGGELLAGIWDEGQKTEVSEAFRATGSPFADQALSAVAPVLDRYAVSWVAMYREVCLASHRGGGPSQQILDLRSLCLQRRREELRAVSEYLVTGGVSILPRAFQATQALSPVDECAEGVEVAMLSPLPRDLAARETIEKLQAETVRQAVLFDTARNADETILEQTAEAARVVGHAPLEAYALHRLGLVVLNQSGDTARSVEIFEAALRAAVRGNDRLEIARLYARLAEVNGYHLGNHERGLWWSGLAEASLVPLGPGHGEAKVQALSGLGTAKWSAGRLAEAEAHWTEALDIAREELGADNMVTLEVLNNLGMLPEDGASRRLEYLEKALELKEKASGAWNPDLANTLVNLAATYAGKSRPEEGLAATRRAAEIIQAFQGEHVDLAYPWTQEAEILNLLDQPAAAEARLLHAREVAKDLNAQHPLRFYLELDLADSKLLQLRLDEAEALYSRARGLVEGLPLESPPRFTLDLSRGRLDLLQGRPKEALEIWEASLEATEAAGIRRSDWESVALLAGLGQAYWQVGRRDAALERLERAVEMADRLVAEPSIEATARFTLAQLLQTDDPARAKALARAADEALGEATSPLSERLRAEIRSWLSLREP